MRSSLIIALAFLAKPTPSLADERPLYEVSANVSHAGAPVASSTAVMEAGKPATVEVTGKDGYKLTFTVTDLAPDQIQVAAIVDTSQGSMDPTVVVRPDEKGSVSLGDLTLDLVVVRKTE